MLVRFGRLGDTELGRSLCRFVSPIHHVTLPQSPRSFDGPISSTCVEPLWPAPVGIWSLGLKSPYCERSVSSNGLPSVPSRLRTGECLAGGRWPSSGAGSSHVQCNVLRGLQSYRQSATSAMSLLLQLHPEKSPDEYASCGVA
jgi:hypothetical protein